MEIRKKSHDEARTYCMKDDTRDPSPGSGPWEHGIPKLDQGTRTDLTTIRAKLDSGVSEKEIAQEHFGDWCRYFRGFQRYRTLSEGKDRSEVEVCIFYGPPGCGKSHQARLACGKLPVYTKEPGCGKWFDGYDGQDVILFDDYDASQPYNHLLRICDRYAVTGECKGGTVKLNATRILFTTMQHPACWYPDHPWPALRRRVHCWVHFDYPERVEEGTPDSYWLEGRWVRSVFRVFSDYTSFEAHENRVRSTTHVN